MCGHASTRWMIVSPIYVLPASGSMLATSSAEYTLDDCIAEAAATWSAGVWRGLSSHKDMLFDTPVAAINHDVAVGYKLHNAQFKATVGYWGTPGRVVATRSIMNNAVGFNHVQRVSSWDRIAAANGQFGSVYSSPERQYMQLEEVMAGLFECAISL